MRKNRAPQARQNDFTRAAQTENLDLDRLDRDARLSGKGALSRRRTIVGSVEQGQLVRDVDLAACRTGRVLRAIGATQCVVQDDGDQQPRTCTVRRLLRTVATEARSAVVTGDRVWYRPEGPEGGVIEQVAPRQGVLRRGHQRREHILVANVTQALIVVSVAEPGLKPALIDRFLLSAAKGDVAAGIAINKVDLCDPAELLPVVGRYSQLGYPVFLTSTQTGSGLDRLREWLRGAQTVVTGQSGVGKSSLLNALEPSLGLRTGTVSEVTQKGRHTTRYAQLLPLGVGGWVVDTPGIRQLELWDVGLGEIEGYFVEFRPFVPHCKFPDCLHLDEHDCAVKAAVDRELIDRARYESYLRLILQDD